MYKTLIINHPSIHCGVHQYGVHMYECLNHNSKNEYVYKHCLNAVELLRHYEDNKPNCILFNYFPYTWKWLNKNVLNQMDCLKVGTYHEVDSNKTNSSFNLFDIELMLDPTFVSTDNRISVPRFLIDWYEYIPERIENVPIISSFGFGTPQKGWVKLLQKVNNQFDEAIVRFNIPFNDIIDPGGRHYTLRTVQLIRNVPIKSGIKLEITHDFFDSTKLLSWLSESTINAFLYEGTRTEGISSVLDWALSVDVPLGISDAPMFRHVNTFTDNANLNNLTFRDVIEFYPDSIKNLKEEWSSKSFTEKIDFIIKDRL